VFLSHDYTASALSAANLKGADRWLYEGLTARGVPVSLLPLVKIYRYIDSLCSSSELEIRASDMHLSNFKVCCIGALEDTRLEEHRNLPADLPFLSPYDKCAVANIEEEQRECIAGERARESIPQ
jgi:hypothetical protein